MTDLEDALGLGVSLGIWGVRLRASGVQVFGSQAFAFKDFWGFTCSEHASETARCLPSGYRCFDPFKP